MATVTTAFTAVGDGAQILSRSGEEFNHTVTGTFVATWVLEKTEDQQTWKQVATGTTTQTITTNFADTTSGQSVNVRFRCDAFTSGTMTTVLSDVTTEVIEELTIKSKTGVDLLQFNESGVVVPGTFNVTGDTTLTGAQTFTGLATYAAGISLTPAATDALIGTIGAAPSSGTNAVTIERSGNFFKLNFTLTLCRIPVTDAGGSGSHGPYKLFDVAQGGVMYLGCRQDYTAFAQVSGVEDDTVFELGVGTTIIASAADGSLGATEDDIGGDVNMTLSSGTATGTAHTASNTIIDGTGTAADINLNFSGTAATVDSNGSIDVTGTIAIVGVLLGDD